MMRFIGIAILCQSLENYAVQFHSLAFVAELESCVLIQERKHIPKPLTTMQNGEVQ